MDARTWNSWRAGLRTVALAAAIAAGTSCGHANTTGRAPSFLIIDSLQASSGAQPDAFGNTLESDVITNVKQTIGGQEVYTPTVFEDLGKVSLRIGLKDTGGANAPTEPSAINSITVTRYHVDFKRSDGRNTPGVDIPYSFDGAATGTFDMNGSSLSFVLVRGQAKIEAPLKALKGGGGSIIISTIATITFYGTDQNGNAVSVTGSISVNFADWGDPTA